MLWYPIGWTAGYLLLLVFVAAPLRRSGAYTLPDFAEFRVESARARQVASWLVCLICGLYLVPQFEGAGLTLAALTGAPTWVGAVVVALVVLVNVAAGGHAQHHARAGVPVLAQAVSRCWCRLFPAGRLAPRRLAGWAGCNPAMGRAARAGRTRCT